MYPVVSPGFGDSAASITEPCASNKSTLLFSRMEKHTYVPAGKTTVPPPAAAAASIALLIAGVSTVLPSPVAPKLRTSKNTGDIPGPATFFGAASAGIADTAEAAKPMLLSLSRSRRAELILVIWPAILPDARHCWKLLQGRNSSLRLRVLTIPLAIVRRGSIQVQGKFVIQPPQSPF